MAFIITEDRPLRRRLLYILLFIVWAVTGGLAYYGGTRQSTQYLESRYQSYGQFKAALKESKAQLRQAEARITLLERSARIDSQAKTDLAHTVRNLQDQVAQYREKIAFYQGIISPADDKSGLDIYDLSLLSSEGDLHHFKLILTQAGKSDTLAEGKVAMTFNGIQGDADKALKLSAIGLSPKKPVRYEFRYFQEIRGSFRFPRGFSPRDVRVLLIPQQSRDKHRPERIFDWQKLRR